MRHRVVLVAASAWLLSACVLAGLDDLTGGEPDASTSGDAQTDDSATADAAGDSRTGDATGPSDAAVQDEWVGVRCETPDDSSVFCDPRTAPCCLNNAGGGNAAGECLAGCTEIPFTEVPLPCASRADCVRFDAGQTCCLNVADSGRGSSAACVPAEVCAPTGQDQLCDPDAADECPLGVSTCQASIAALRGYFVCK